MTPTGGMTMTVAESPTGTGGTILLVTLSGEVDGDARDELHRFLTDPRLAQVGTWVHVDVAAVTFFDPTGLTFLARLGARCPGRVRLDHPSAFLVRLLHLTGVHELVEVGCPSRAVKPTR